MDSIQQSALYGRIAAGALGISGAITALTTVTDSTTALIIAVVNLISAALAFASKLREVKRGKS